MLKKQTQELIENLSIRDFRDMLGFTRENLSKMLKGIDPSAIFLWESGRSVPSQPNQNALNRLMDDPLVWAYHDARVALERKYGIKLAKKQDRKNSRL